jgi:sn-glycerol 3-phosphate transport system substrate-binding protein
MSRTFACLIAISLFCLSLAACGGEEGASTEKTSGTGATGGTVTIDFWHSEQAASQSALQALIDRFNASQSEVRVRLIFQGTPIELNAKVVNSLGSGDLPALIETNEGDSQTMIDSGAVTPVQKFIDAEGYDLSDFDQRAVDFYTWDGKLCAMPLGIIVPMLFYNKIPFQEVGLDPTEPPQTLDDVRAYSEKLLKVDGAGNVVRSGIALDLQPWYLYVVMGEHGDLVVNNNNGRDGRATEALFNNATGQAFFRWWDQMVDSGLALNVGRNPSGADALMAVATGRAAMAISISSALRSAIDVVEAGLEGVELGVGPFPGVAGGSVKPPIFSRSLLIMNQRSEAEQQAAWKLIRWLDEPEQQAELFAGTGFLPVRLSAYQMDAAREVLQKYPLYQVPVDLSSGVPSTPASLGPRVGPSAQAGEIVAQALEEMVVGGKDPDQALEDAAAGYTKELQEYTRRLGE